MVRESSLEGFRPIHGDYDQGVAIAAGPEARTWHGGKLSPETHQSGYYRKENTHGRAILLFHEILHHITGGLDAHEEKGIMAKYTANTPLTVGDTYAAEIEKAGGKSVAELKAAGLVQEAAGGK